MENFGDPTSELKNSINNLLKDYDLFSSLFEVALEEDCQLYLVGGLIRDLLLGHSSKDLDFVTTRASHLVGSLAKRTGCRAVLIDQRFGTIRLIPATKSDNSNEFYLLDISPMRGSSIEEDLRRRDFTVNAMAIDISAWLTTGIFELFDPLGGLSDLRANRLRVCAPDSFVDDPLRILRAYRLVSRYGLTLDSQARKRMAELRYSLKSVAVERIRDEIALILSGVNSASILRMLNEDSLLGELFPQSGPIQSLRQNDYHHQDVWQHSISALEALEFFLLRPQELLGRYSQEATAVLAQRIAGERTRQTMLKFAALLQNIGKSRCRSLNNNDAIHFDGHQAAGARMAGALCARLRFSNKEIDFVSQIVRQHLRPIHLLNQAETSQKALARFFRLGPELFWPLLLLLGSNHMAARGPKSPNGTIRPLRQCIRGWLDFYYEQLKPREMEPPLLNGRQLMEYFHLSPGPIVGKLLHNLADLQWEGRITSREEALEHATQLLEKWKREDRSQ